MSFGCLALERAEYQHGRGRNTYDICNARLKLREAGVKEQVIEEMILKAIEEGHIHKGGVVSLLFSAPLPKLMCQHHESCPIKNRLDTAGTST